MHVKIFYVGYICFAVIITDMNIWLKILIMFVVFHKVKMKRLVVNTTCLELAKPSNQQLRLTCSQYDYHCLLDETFTNEFEVCREWKWIPGGRCAYFNTYEAGNIDGRRCINSGKWLCPNMQYSSEETTNYPACHMKKTSVAITTSSFQVASEYPSDKNNSTSLQFHETIGKTNVRAGIIIISVYLSIGVTILLLSIVWYLRYRKVANGRGGTESSSRKRDARTVEHQPLNDGSNKSHIMKGNSAESMQGSQFDPTIACDDDDSLDAFYMAQQSKATETDEEDKEDKKLCTELFNLFAEDGLKLSERVLTAVITRTTGKSIAELVDDETVRNKMKAMEPIFLKSSLKPWESIRVLNALLTIFLKEEDSPKSGWTTQPSERDTGIGDDVVRLLNCIMLFSQETKNIGNIYVESYIRQLDNLIGAVTRLDTDAKFENENIKLAYEIEAIKNRRLTKTIMKKNRKTISHSTNKK